jgi:hypothetical protein
MKLNFFQSLFKGGGGKKFTIFTGGHLKYTKDLISKINETEKSKHDLSRTLGTPLILYKNYEPLKDDFYDKISKYAPTQVFNCDILKPDDNEELVNFLKTKNYKVNIIL